MYEHNTPCVQINPERTNTNDTVEYFQEHKTSVSNLPISQKDTRSIPPLQVARPKTKTSHLSVSDTNTIELILVCKGSVYM